MNVFVSVMIWLISAGAGAAFFAMGVRYGKQKARIEDTLKALHKCQEAHDVVFMHPERVACPCQCNGILEDHGSNRAGTNTSLICSKCRCAYIAPTVDHIIAVKRG